MTDSAGREVAIQLHRDWFNEAEHPLLRFGGLSATSFRYPTGVEAIRLSNTRGSVVVLPYLGQIVWRATFDGVELAMQSMFDMPRPVSGIIETYGALMYHAGLLRNGVPGPGDTHPVHGEMPCMPMDDARLVCGSDAQGAFVSIVSRRDYAIGFGAHYLATPTVTLREHATRLDIRMTVENLSDAPMDLMYLCHANFSFAEGARIVQPVPFDVEHVVTRTAVPQHVTPTPEYRAFVEKLAAEPAVMERLTEPNRYNPEQVCYIKGLKPGADGQVEFMLARREGDGFTVAYDPTAMPHCIRWVLHNSDQRVAAFAMPATCEPEGYTAEKRKGHVRTLAGRARETFSTTIGYVNRAEAAALAARIDAQAKGA